MGRSLFDRLLQRAVMRNRLRAVGREIEGLHQQEMAKSLLNIYASGME